jgi:F-box associated protein
VNSVNYCLLSLPNELIYRTLLETPVMEMRRVRAVCKLFNDMINAKEFLQHNAARFHLTMPSNIDNFDWFKHYHLYITLYSPHQLRLKSSKEAFEGAMGILQYGDQATYIKWVLEVSYATKATEISVPEIYNSLLNAFRACRWSSIKVLLDFVTNRLPAHELSFNGFLSMNVVVEDDRSVPLILESSAKNPRLTEEGFSKCLVLSVKNNSSKCLELLIGYLQDHAEVYSTKAYSDALKLILEQLEEKEEIAWFEKVNTKTHSDIFNFTKLLLSAVDPILLDLPIAKQTGRFDSIILITLAEHGHEECLKIIFESQSLKRQFDPSAYIHLVEILAIKGHIGCLQSFLLCPILNNIPTADLHRAKDAAEEQGQIECAGLINNQIIERQFETQ